MSAKQTVPRLDLAPKLKRPLQLWNPLDYLRLLYWVFFFPQAMRWYVETFADLEYCEATGRDLLRGLREDPVQRNLALQGLLLTVLVLFILLLFATQQWWSPLAGWEAVLVLYFVGFMAFGVGLCAVSGLASGVTLSIASSVIFGVALYVMEIVAIGLIVMVTVVVPFDVPSGVVGSAMAGMWFGMVFGVTLNAVNGVTSGVKVYMTRYIGYGVVFILALGVSNVFDPEMSAAEGMTLILAFSIAVGLTGLRLPDYFVLGFLSAWGWPRKKRGQPWGVSHVVCLPLLGFQKRLEACLSQDWAASLANVNQLLAYTLQFIPLVQAVNAVLARTTQERLLTAVSNLAEEPFDWNLVRFGSASLRNAVLNNALAGLVVPLLFRRLWQARFPVEPRLDTPARAACAGFWYLHEGDLVSAVKAFTVVRPLPGGEELLLTTVSLAMALGVDYAATVAHWLEFTAGLAELPEPHLRPAVVHTLRCLREVAAEADLARHAVSPLMRSSAIGRAVAALTQLLSDVEETCPQPECAIVKTIAERWRDILAAAGGEIGEQVLRQPVENPYEGYSGLPVESTFVGREGVLARLERLWAASSSAPLPPIILYGHRRMGKTSVIHYLHRHRSPRTLIARTDMQDLAMADHTGQLLFGFARAIHAAAQEARLDVGPVPDMGDYATTGTARLALNALLDQLDPEMTGRRLTLAVDEYEIAEGKIEEGKFDADFLRYLRSAAQRHRWVGLLFAGRQTLEDELRHYRAVFFGSAEPVRVSFLTREAALDLIRRPSYDFALEYEEPLAEELYQLTNGQPYLLQRLCWELVNRWNDRFLREGEETPRVLTHADLEALLTPDFYHNFFLQADYYFSGVWDEAGPDEHSLLLALSTRADEQPLPRADLIQAAGLDPDEAETAIEAALRHDLIAEEDGGFRLAVPLMRRWVAQRW